MVNLVISFILLLFPPFNNLGTFEGRIELVQETHYEKSYFTYFIKNDNVRIDEFDSDHLLIQSLIIKINDEQVYILCPSKKLYTQLTLSDSKKMTSDNFKIIKTENSRIVNGFDCYQWRVKNIERNTEAAYWVSQNNFYFFEDLIKLLNRTDKTFEFFEIIPDSQGFFPMLSVERTLLRKEKLRTYVVAINNEILDESNFIIPPEYKPVEN
ncbi:MAG: DUF4412 domain-containing protein [Bacteroidales bacterium]|nr:DUF4412 domain-containing protein [Bacteroidales bacterium]